MFSREECKFASSKITSLMTEDGKFVSAETIKTVGIGTRVKLIYVDVTDEFALPHWTIDKEAEQPQKPWRYPEE